jgi:hypothetical protein
MPTDDLSRRAFLRLDWLRPSDGDGDTDDADDPDETITDESVDPQRTPASADDRRAGLDDRPAAD